jgi:hypothetical protein
MNDISSLLEKIEDRREFIIDMATLGFGLVLLEPIVKSAILMDASKDDNIARSLNDQIGKSTKTLVENFRISGQHELMQRYVGGFASFISMSMKGNSTFRYGLIERAQLICDERLKNNSLLANHHRVRAFPACLSAHILSCMEGSTDQSDRGIAATIIDHAFSIEQLEVQEILLQNMISALQLDDYAWEHFYVSNSTLENVLSYIKRRQENPLLNFGCTHAIHFLLSYRLAIKMRALSGSMDVLRRDQTKQISKSLEYIENSKDENAWLTKQWLKLLSGYYKEKKYMNSRHAIGSVPPQASELMLGWRNCINKGWEDILQIAIAGALFHLFINEKNLIGEPPWKWKQELYTETEAYVALNKSREWFNKIGIDPALLMEAIKVVPDIYRTRFSHYAKKLPHDNPISEWHATGSKVPFRELLDIPRPAKFSETAKLMRTFIGGGLTLRGFIGILKEISRLLWIRVIGPMIPPDVEVQVRPDDKEIDKKLEAEENLKPIKEIEKSYDDPQAYYDYCESDGYEQDIAIKEFEDKAKD